MVMLIHACPVLGLNLYPGKQSLGGVVGITGGTIGRTEPPPVEPWCTGCEVELMKIQLVLPPSSVQLVQVMELVELELRTER